MSGHQDVDESVQEPADRYREVVERLESRFSMRVEHGAVLRAVADADAAIVEDRVQIYRQILVEKEARNSLARIATSD